MKKFTLIAAAAVVAMSASAQYNTDKISTAQALEGMDKAYVDYIILNSAVSSLLENDPHYTLQYCGPDNDTRHLYIWPDGTTLTAGQSTYPGADGVEGYMSLDSSDIGWQGAGYNIGDTGGVNFSHFSDNTIFHLAYMSQSSTPMTSMYLTILDKETAPAGGESSVPGKVSLGTSQEGKPTIGAAPNDDWQAVEITLGELKKECPTFKLGNKDNWRGNILAFGGAPNSGWPAFVNISFDACYFITPNDGSGIQSISNEVVSPIMVSGRTISCADAASIELYSLNGQLVKSAQGTVMGMENLSAGVYVAKAGNKAAKVVVK